MVCNRVCDYAQASIASYYLKSWLVPFGSWWTVKALLLHLHIYLNCRSKCRWQRCCFAAAVANRVKPFGKKRRVEQQAGQQRETNWKWQHRTSIVLLNRHILRGIIENYLLTLYSIHYTTTTHSCDILFLLKYVPICSKSNVCDCVVCTLHTYDVYSKNEVMIYHKPSLKL